MVTIFLRISPTFAEQMGIFLKKCHDEIFAKTSCSLSKENPPIFLKS
jgi:hypothetical protein